MHLTVLDTGEEARSRLADERRRRMLAWLDEWRQTPLTEEEERILDEFPAFRKEHPFRLRRLDLEEGEP